MENLQIYAIYKTMAEGINMGRKSPWSKDYLKKLYDQVVSYSKVAALYALKTEGQQAMIEAMAAYNMFKYPVVYIYIHYHFGSFEDLGMRDGDISSYMMMYMSSVKYFTQSMMDGMMKQSIFDFDKKNEIAPALVEICREVLFIENNV